MSFCLRVLYTQECSVRQLELWMYTVYATWDAAACCWLVKGKLAAWGSSLLIPDPTAAVAVTNTGVDRNESRYNSDKPLV